MTTNSFFKTITTVHKFLVLGILSACTAFYFIIKNWYFNFDDSENIFFYILPLATLFSVSIGNYVYPKIIKIAFKKETLKEKLTVFFTASIVKYALIECIAFIGIIAGVLSSNLFYLLFSVGLALYMYTLKPTKGKIINELKLSPREKKEFLNN